MAPLAPLSPAGTPRATRGRGWLRRTLVTVGVAIGVLCAAQPPVTAQEPEPEPPAIQPVEYWQQQFGAAEADFHADNVALTTSGDSWDLYNAAYGIDGYTAMYEATGDSRYIDRALEYTNNMVGTSRVSSTMSTSQYRDNYRGWLSRSTIAQHSSVLNKEVPLFESYNWRYVTRMLRVIRQSPELFGNSQYRQQYDALLNFSEVHMFEKWYNRGAVPNIYRERVHIVSHWAYIAVNLSLLTNDGGRLQRYREVFNAINRDLPNYNSSLRDQLRVANTSPPAYFWHAEWGRYDAPGQDVPHGNNFISYVVEAHGLGQEWTNLDIERFLGTLARIWPAENEEAAYVDGSGAGTGWFSDGFVKLGRYDPAMQIRLETHRIQGPQYFATMANNARILADPDPGPDPVPGADPSTFQGITPARLLETRSGLGLTTVDGQFQGTGKFGQFETRNVKVAGRGGVPANASAVVLNVTVTEPTAFSFLTAFPAGTQRPLASNLNFTNGQTIPNSVMVKVGTGGQISLYNHAGATHVLVDVLGYFGPTSAFTGLSPARLLETRAGNATVDGQSQSQGAIGPGQTRDVVVTGRGGVPATGVGAVVLNVTVTEPTAAGFLTVFPTGAARPGTSNVSFARGQTIPNLVVVPVGADGKVSFYNHSGSAHTLADVAGWFPTGGAFNGLDSVRLLDTRSGGTTVDGAAQGTGPIGQGQTGVLTVAGRGGVPPTGAGSVVLNVTVTQPTAFGFLTVFPAGQPRPVASNMNFTQNQTISALVVVKVGTNGQVALYNHAGSSHVLVDILGWFPP